MMIDVIDDRRSKTPPAPPSSPSSLFDPRADWKPQWTGKKDTPHDRQEAQAPTENVNIRLSSERTVSKSRRRIVDARLWESMTPAQQDAAIWIAAGYETIGRGMGYVTSNWENIPGCSGPGNAPEAHGHLIKAYMKWAEECARRKISHSMIVDVLCFGFSCRMIDRDRRLRTGSTRGNLMQGLDLYDELAGWKRRSR